MLGLYSATVPRVHRRPHFNPQVEQLLSQHQNPQAGPTGNDQQTARNRSLHAQIEESQGYEPQRIGHPQREYG